MTRLRLLALFLSIILGFTLAGCQLKSDDTLPQAKENNSVNSLVTAWQKKNPDKVLIKWAQGDLNNDKRPDTVIIYQVKSHKCRMRVLLNLPGGMTATGEEPAPLANQTIEIKNIDNRLPLELVITGVKGTNAGYAIYRVQGVKLINLFGQDMDKCC